MFLIDSSWLICCYKITYRSSNMLQSESMPRALWGFPLLPFWIRKGSHYQVPLFFEAFFFFFFFFSEPSGGHHPESLGVFVYFQLWEKFIQLLHSILEHVQEVGSLSSVASRMHFQEPRSLIMCMYVVLAILNLGWHLMFIAHEHVDYTL